MEGWKGNRLGDRSYGRAFTDKPRSKKKKWSKGKVKDKANNAVILDKPIL